MKCCLAAVYPLRSEIGRVEEKLWLVVGVGRRKALSLLEWSSVDCKLLLDRSGSILMEPKKSGTSQDLAGKSEIGLKSGASQDLSGKSEIGSESHEPFFRYE